MNLLKVALLEDNEILLKERKTNLEENGLAKVVVWSTDPSDFLKKVKEEKPQALFLDIELDNSMTGLEVAHMIKLPVMFVSGYNGQNVKQIESIQREHDFPVDHITKPFSENEFIKAATRFLKEIEEYYSSFVYLTFNRNDKKKIDVNNIIYIHSDKSQGAEYNNKQIFFSDRKPEILVDFSFNKMDLYGFKKNQFITVHRSTIVNHKHILSYNKVKHQIEVEAMNTSGKKQRFFLSVSENFKMQ